MVGRNTHIAEQKLEKSRNPYYSYENEKKKKNIVTPSYIFSPLLLKPQGLVELCARHLTTGKYIIL